MFSKRLRQPLGLGILINQRGLALAQAPTYNDAKQSHPAWHWQAFSAHSLLSSTSEWPEPHCLRWARQRSGFSAQSVAMALPPDKLLRFTFNISSGMAPRQLQAHLQAQLAPLLPWPVHEALWDYQLSQPHDSAGNRAGLPGLRNNPLLGWLFGNRASRSSKQELLIFLSPKMLEQSAFAP